MLKLTYFIALYLIYFSLLSYASDQLLQYNSEDEGERVAVLVQSRPLISCCKWNNQTKEVQCKGCRSEWTNLWKIHGLWPVWQNNNKSLTYCSDKPINGINLNVLRRNKLIGVLSKFWFSNKGVLHNFEFWNYQWQKHGSCTRSYFSDVHDYSSYFKQTLKLYNNYHVGSYLKELKTGRDYSFNTLYALVKRSLGGKHPIIICYRSYDQQFLAEIEICFDTKFQLIDCTHRSNAVDGKIYYHRAARCEEKQRVIYI